jgi:outer membrane lipoprotein-sorting protein
MKRGEWKMNKKWTSGLLSLALASSIGVGAFAAESAKSDLKVTFNGESLSLAQSAVIVNDRMLLPYRAVSEQLGATVNYDEASKSVTVMKGANVYVLTLGSKLATVNGVEVSLDVPAQSINHSTYVPVRFLSENLGVQVGYDSATKTVSLNTSSASAFKVSGVNQGDILYTNQVKVAVAAFNHELADFRTNTEAKDGQGHIHLWLDTNAANPKLAYKLINGEPVVFDNVKPGDHTLTVQLVGANHKPISPAVKQVIHFKTK